VGTGYLELRPGVWIDGVFKDAADDLFRYTTPVASALKESLELGQKTTACTVLERAIKAVQAGHYSDALMYIDAARNNVEELS